MDWRQDFFQDLDEAGVFQDAMHRSRFEELVDCYHTYPFFSSGLCKCMYLSAWDDVHFGEMLQILMEMSLGHNKDTSQMREQGDELAEEHRDDKETESDYYIYQLSNCFLDDIPFTLDYSHLPEESIHIIRQALKAASVIDLWEEEAEFE